MRVPRRRRTWGLRFNITPLIDIIFLLIIFFLAASHLVRSETLQEVDLPEAAGAEQDRDEVPRRLTVTIASNGQFHVRGETVAAGEVEQMIRSGRAENGDSFEVRIRSDRSVAYEVIEPLMLTCARSGVSNVKFAVLPKQE